ncbi:MAG: heme exporter protein CcmB [Trueperaceae bacterium]|nr:heme exporter protein CcmB [Trueperaceae bacterium]
MNDLRAMLAVAHKDVRSELRSRAATVATVFFSSVTLVVLAFALGREQSLLTSAAPGALWIALAFSGVITAAQGYQSDLHEGAYEQLLTLPVPRAALFLGKLAANWIAMTVLGLVLLPFVAVLYDAPIGAGYGLLVLTVALGTLGFATIAGFYAALTANLHARESLLPVLTFPVVVPVLLAAVRSTDAIVRSGDLALSGAWVQLLAGFDLVYLVVTSAIFHFVVEE